MYGLCIMISIIYLVIWLRQREKLFLFWFIAVLLWQTIPSFLNNIYSEFDESISFNSLEKIEVYLFELLGLLIWSIPFLFLPKINSLRQYSVQAKRRFKFIVNLYFLFGIILLLKNFTGLNLNLPLSFLYIALATKIVPVYCVYLIFTSQKIIVRLLCLIVLLVSIIGGGSHGPFVFLGIYAIYLSFSRRVFKFYTLTFIILGIAFLSSFGDLMHEVRSLDVGKVSKLTIAEKLVLISGLSSEVNGYKVSKNIEEDSGVMKDAIWRFGENRRVSSGYIRWVDRYGYVGFAPVLNSFVSIVPREFWSEKPEPGSYDGHVYGKGMYIVHRMTYGNEKNMSGFYTGLHEYWQFGIMGILLFSLVAGFLQYFVLVKLFSFGEPGMLIIIAAYSIWWQMPKLWLSEVILHLFTIYLPIFIFYIVILITLNISKRVRLKY